MIIVDSNILAYLYLPQESQIEIRLAAEQLLIQDADWGAPILWRSEFRNILAGYIHRNTITFEQAYQIQRNAESLLAGNEYDVDSLSVLTLVNTSECSAYDCEFVALAKQLNVVLVTMDKKILRAFPDIAKALI